MNRILVLFLFGLLFSSCGLFLQDSGVKNYTPQEKIPQQGLNNYQYDFLYLCLLLEDGFPQLDSIFPKEQRQKQVEQILALLENVENNTDFIIYARKYLSNLKNQHTTISLSHEFKMVYPYVIYNSSDGWYLLNLSEQYDSLQIGKKIIEINGFATSQVENALIDYTFAENKINQQFEVRDLQLYNKPEYLKQIGVIKQDFEVLKLKFEDTSEIELSTESKVEVFDVSFKQNPITKYRTETYLYSIHNNQKFGYLQFNRCHDKTDILDGIETYVKPWLQPIAKGYVKSQFKKNKPSKRLADLYNPKHPVFKDFVWDFIDSLNTNKIEHLIIDLRNNPGGNLMLGIQLMYFLTSKDTLKGFNKYAFTSGMYKKYFTEDYQDLQKKHPEGVPPRDLIQTNAGENLFDEIMDKNSNYYIQKGRPVFKGKVYVLSNDGTGSAAAMLTILFQDNKIGKVIGTSVGNNATGASTYTPMQLPRTKAKVSIATTYIERPDKTRGKIQIPDIWVEYTIDDLINGKDPYLETVKKEIERTSSH